MSFSALRDIFLGRADADQCVQDLLSLKSPNKTRQYLVKVHEIVFPFGDRNKNKRWNIYSDASSSVSPIKEKNLSDREFMKKQANKLSFDISRFTDFLAGYTQVNDDLKPIMLHYSMIYLLDFFSRTWLKYGQNWGHGIKLASSANEHLMKVRTSGIFPRAVDAFYLVYQPSIFSLDEDTGIICYPNLEGENILAEVDKKRKYSRCPELGLTALINMYEKLNQKMPFFRISKSNLILVGYIILFAVSSISRYKAEDWFKIRENRDLKNRLDLLQYDFLYEWTPEILMETILKDAR